MDRSEFEQLYCCTFATTDKDDMTHKLATQYHEECEIYDKTVCSGERDGVAIPIDGRELSLINKNARVVHDTVMYTAKLHGISGNEMRRAIQQWDNNHG